MAHRGCLILVLGLSLPALAAGSEASKETATKADTKVSDTKVVEQAPELVTSVVRINNKRFKKVSSGTASVYVPSIGLPLAASLHEVICPKSLGPDDEVLVISKSGPADSEVKASAAELLREMSACGERP